MSKNQNKFKNTNRKPTPVIHGKINKPNKKTIGDFLNLEIVILLLYLLTEFVPRFDAYDVMGGQWLYLSILNCITTVYLLINKKVIPNRIFRSVLFLLYSGFMLISVLSFFVSYNVIESIVCYSRLIVCFIAFINILSIINYNYNSKILHHLFLLIGIIVLFQSLDVLLEFISNFQNFSRLDDLIMSLKGNSGNKNILAASIVLKIPFVIYAIYKSDYLGKIFYFVTFFICCTALFIVNARSSYISLFLEVFIYLILVTIFYFKNSKEISVFIKPVLMIGLLIISILFSLFLFSTKSGMIKGTYGGISQRVETIELSNKGSSSRVRLWSSSIDFIKKNPVLGGGYGNWKIHSCNYEKYWQNGYGAIEKHVHNDFLETTADTGSIGGIIYAGIFICLYVYTLIILLSGKAALENKMIVGTILMSLVAYTIDAIFNFPLERPNIQVLLAIFMAIIGFYYIEIKQTKQNIRINKNIKIAIIWLFIIISLITVYVNYNVFKSLEIQNKISIEWSGKHEEAKIPFKSKDINPYFPWIPNINENGMPIASIKAKYLFQEQKYNEALEILNSDKGSNPYLYYSEYLRGRIAEKLDQADSAYYYAKLAFYNRPATEYLYVFLNDLAVTRKDSNEIENSYKELSKWNNRPQYWCPYFAIQILKCTGSLEKIIVILDNGLKKFPKDSTLLYMCNFYNGVSLYEQKSFERSINYFNESLKYKYDANIIQNIGMAYYNIGSYRKAIPYYSDIINNNLLYDGKTEYFRGMCYKQIGQKDSACSDLMSAKAKGYAVAPTLFEGCK